MIILEEHSNLATLVKVRVVPKINGKTLSFCVIFVTFFDNVG